MIRLFRVFVPTSVLMVLVTDLILITGCFLAATLLVVDFTEIFLLYENGLWRMTLAVGSVMFGLYFQNLYADLRVRSNIVLVQQLALVIGTVFLSQALLTYVNRDLMMPRWIMIFGCGLILVTLPVWRAVFSLYGLDAGGQKILFLGSNAVAQAVAERIIAHPELGMYAVGVLSDQHAPGHELFGTQVLGGISFLRQAVAEYKPDRIVVGLTERRQSLPVHDLLDIRFLGVRIEEAAATYEAATGRVATTELRPSQLIFSSELGPIPRAMRLQTLYSVFIAAVAILLSAPIMLLVAIAVKLTSKGPILFRQKRVGLNGDTFTVFKFRTMRVDAEAKTGAVWATRNDPRVTSIGRQLRKTRLDEFPQLFNVLRGDMSVVGPRPERPEFVRTLTEQIPFYRQRHCVKPGITGWAQINYKYGETLQDTIIKLEYDLYYIKNLSFSLDMYIMFHTAKVMLFSTHGQ